MGGRMASRCAWVCVLFAGAVAAMAARPAQAAFQPVDMRAVVNMGWQDDKAGDGQGGWTDQGGTDMRGMETGRRTLLGIPFDVIDPATNGGKAELTLGSKKFPAGPMDVTLPVNAAARSIYFLHASAWTGGQMATYVIHYADGTSAEIPIIAKEEIADWWGPKNGPKYRVAFHMPNLATDDVGMYVFGWDNPSPDKPIKSIEFKSADENGIVVVAAVTLSSDPVKLPAPEDVPVPDYLKSDEDTIDWSQWFPVEQMTDPFKPTPIDQSANLDAPAGKHGFMKNVDGEFVFEDGTPVRPVGAMMSPYDPKKERADYYAHWMAKYGFTMVRIGHLVTGPGSDSVVDWKQPDTGHLDPEVMDRIDFFIAKLAERGIYTRPTMLWYRKMKEGDGVYIPDEIKEQAKKDKAEPLLNSMCITFFDPKVMQANIDLEVAIMTHRNPYRDNKMWGEDPAIAQTEVTNEDSMFFYTVDSIPDYYKQELTRVWCDWLLKKYGSQEALSKAWGGHLDADESLKEGTVKRMLIWEFNNVPAEKLGRAQDQLRFYYELANNYFNKTKDALRAAGVEQPLCGSGWQGVGVGYWTEIYSNVPGMDYTDRHHYWGGGPSWQVLPGLEFKDVAALTKPETILKLGTERVITMPYGVSEWASVLPDQWRLEAAPLMAFYGNCLNGWQMPMHFAISLGGFDGDSGFTQLMKWSWPVNTATTLCQYPALSQVIRKQEIEQGKPAFIRNISEAEVFGAQPLKNAAVEFETSGPYAMSESAGVNARSLAAIYATAVGKVGIDFSREDKPDYSIDLTKYIDLEKKQIRSADGQLYWDYGTGYVTANTPLFQAAVGFLDGVPVELADCYIVTGNVIASILVSSWDGKPISESKHILITAVGRSRNTGETYTRGGRRLLTLGTEPVLLEGVKGGVVIKHSGTCTVTALSPHGYKTVDVQPIYRDGTVTIPMDGKDKAAYYDVEFE